ncbi:ATP-binding cassette domain-containing protein, partial [Okeania hirsuta]
MILSGSTKLNYRAPCHQIKIFLVPPSTIAKLICGLYQPWEGEILFDGVPRENISPTVLTHSLSMVEQEIFLFGGTVRDNL